MDNLIYWGLEHVNKQKIISQVNSSQEIKDILLRNLESVQKDGFFISNSCFHRSILLADYVKNDLKWNFVIDLHQPQKIGYGKSKTVHFALELETSKGLVYVEYKNGKYFIGEGAYPETGETHMIEKIGINEINSQTSLENIANKLTHINLQQEVQFDERLNFLYGAYQYLEQKGKTFDGTNTHTLLNPQVTLISQNLLAS